MSERSFGSVSSVGLVARPEVVVCWEHRGRDAVFGVCTDRDVAVCQERSSKDVGPVGHNQSALVFEIGSEVSEGDAGLGG